MHVHFEMDLLHISDHPIISPNLPELSRNRAYLSSPERRFIVPWFGVTVNVGCEGYTSAHFNGANVFIWFFTGIVMTCITSHSYEYFTFNSLSLSLSPQLMLRSS